MARHNNRRRRWPGAQAGIALAVVLVLGGCQQAPESEPAATIATTADRSLVEGASSGDWATRKLAQRQLHLLGDDAAKRRLAVALVARLPALDSRKATLRSVGQAYQLNQAATLAEASKLVADKSLSLVRRAAIVQVLLPKLDQTQAPPAFTALAQELLADADPHSSEWTVALQMLTRLAPEKAWPLIEERLAGEIPQRRAAAAALRMHVFPQSKTVLAGLLEDADKRVRRRAFEAMRAFPTLNSTTQMEQALKRETNLKNCSRALEATAALTRLPTQSEAAATLLIARLEATEGCGPVHRFAILAEFRRILRRQPTPSLRSALKRVVRHPRELAEAAYAAAALGDVALAERISEAGASEGLVMLASESQETHETRLATVAALGRRGDDRSVRRLESLLGRVHERADMLQAVFAALQVSDNVHARNAFLLVPYTSAAEDPSLRRAAVQTLAELGDGVAVARRLQDLLADRDVAVAALARRGLQRIAIVHNEAAGAADPHSWQPLVESLRAQDAQAKAAAKAAAVVPESAED